MKNIIYNFLKSRHYWRHATFGEMSELYTSRFLRVIAMNIISGFTSVYLIEQGYPMFYVMIFWFCYFVFKVGISTLSGRLVGYVGPKHSILISNLLYVPAMAFLGMMPQIGFYSIALWGFFMAISTTLYSIGFMVDLSKVKNASHAGKELAFLSVIDKITFSISPVIGGSLTLVIGISNVIWLSAILFALSSIPLFKTIEPVMIRQKIDFRRLSLSKMHGELVASAAIGFDYVTTGIVWNIFIVIAVFPAIGSDVYIKLGALSSVTVIASVLMSFVYGRVIDKNKGGELLRYSAIANSIVHMSRVFAINVPSVIFTNIANEAATMGYSMSFTRGVMDTADLTGQRIAYMSIHSIFSNIGAALACLVLAFILLVFSVAFAIKVFFVISAVVVLLIGLSNFRLYQR